MSNYREPITVALLALLAATTGAQVATRRFSAIDEVANGDLPYLILMQDREIIDPSMQQAGSPAAEHRMQFKVLLYNAGDGTENSVPATNLNNMIDAIEDALRPKGLQPNYQKLGLPYVLWTTINGPIEYDGSAYGNLGLAVIPIEVTYS